MMVTGFKGYREGEDLSMIPAQYLAYPAKNVLVNKGKVVTRGGLENDGTAKTEDTPIHSEIHWKEAIGGNRFIRVWGQTVQVKFGTKWYTIFTALDSNVTRVFFASWTDSNGAIVKKRLVMCDGSTNLYTWNGFIGTVESVAANVLTMEADKASLGLMGADAGDVTAQTVIVYDSDDITVSEEESYTDDPTSGLDITLGSAPSGFTVAAGDIVIAKPVTFADAIDSATEIDVVYNFENHVVAASYDRVDLHFSHRETYSLATGLDFTQPGAGSRTAITAIHLYLDAKFTAMGSRKNVLWVSDRDDWYKVTKTVEQNAYDLWTDVEKFEAGELKGALPMAVAKHKGDLIYLSQDNRLQRITTIDVIGKDDILLLSDDVEAMLTRLDMNDVRLYYIERGVFIILPDESTTLILDTAEQTWYFQPPQDIPMSCMSIVDGIKYGHHNARNETFKLFSGRKDLGAAMAEAVITIGLQHDGHGFRLKKHGIIGIDCRLTDACEVEWNRQFEEDASRLEDSATFKGSEVKKFNSDVDGSWAAHPYASLPWGGNDDSNDVYRAFVFDRDRADGYFEYRPLIRINGSASEFHLLGFYWEDAPSPRNIPAENFIGGAS